MATPHSVLLSVSQLETLTAFATPDSCGCRCDNTHFERELGALRPEQRARFAPSAAELHARARAAVIDRSMRLPAAPRTPLDRCLSSIARLVHL